MKHSSSTPSFYSGRPFTSYNASGFENSLMGSSQFDTSNEANTGKFADRKFSTPGSNKSFLLNGSVAEDYSATFSPRHENTSYNKTRSAGEYSGFEHSPLASHSTWAPIQIKFQKQASDFQSSTPTPDHSKMAFSNFQQPQVQTPQSQIIHQVSTPQKPRPRHQKTVPSFVRAPSSRTASSSGFTDLSYSQAPPTSSSALTVLEQEDDYENSKKLLFQLLRKNREVEVLTEEVNRLNQLLEARQNSNASVILPNETNHVSMVDGSPNNVSRSCPEILTADSNEQDANGVFSLESDFIVIDNTKYPVSHGIETAFRKLNKRLQEKTEQLSKLQYMMDATMFALSSGSSFFSSTGFNNNRAHRRDSSPSSAYSRSQNEYGSNQNASALPLSEQYRSVDQVELAHRIVNCITTLQDENKLLGHLISQERYSLKEVEIKLLREENEYLKARLEKRNESEEKGIEGPKDSNSTPMKSDWQSDIEPASDDSVSTSLKSRNMKSS